MISVVIPMYNASETILSSLESVLNQSYTGKVEIIIVNDGSTDDSLEKVSDYVLKNRLDHVLIIDKENGGASSSRNAGMKIAKGDFIALLDSDDEWEKEKLQIQVELLFANPDISLLGCNRNSEKFNRFFFTKFNRLTVMTSRLLLYKNFFPTPTVIFRRNILDKIGFFDENQKYSEEGNYWLRICHEEKCVLLNESHVITGRGKPSFGFSGLSSNLKEMEKGELKNIKEAFQMGVVSRPEYYFLLLYSYLKYIRRIIIVKLR